MQKVYKFEIIQIGQNMTNNQTVRIKVNTEEVSVAPPLDLFLFKSSLYSSFLFYLFVQVKSWRFVFVNEPYNENEQNVYC